MRIDTGDAVLDVIVEGTGPLVIALHGFPDSRETFSIDLVGPGFRLARPAMRGYAPSGPSRSGRYDIESLGRDVVALADALSPGDPVRLVGHDWGAIAASAASRLAPRRFTHLVTIAVPPPRLTAFLRPAQLFRSSYIALFQLPFAERLLAAGDGYWIERLWRTWSPGFACPPDRMAAVKKAVLADPSAVLGYYRALRGGLSAAQPLPGPRHLHLHGDRDGCIAPDIAHHARAAMPDLRLEILPGGHFVHLEAPAAVAESLTRFLSSPAPKP